MSDSIIPFDKLGITPVIPKMYWDVYSDEQRVKELCRAVDGIYKYAATLGNYYVPTYGGAWDGTKAYDPNTLVKDSEQNSWLSLKAVPAGTELAEGEYWVEVYTYDAQLENVQAGLDAITPLDSTPTQDSTKGVTSGGVYASAAEIADKLDAYETSNDAKVNAVYPLDSTPTSGSAKGVTSGGVYSAIHASDLTEFVVIGDSWSAKINPMYTGTVWSDLYANYTGLTQHNYAVNGTGFVENSTATTTFQVQATQAIDDSSFDNDKVKNVFIMGGINDVNNNTGNVSNALPDATYHASVSDTLALIKNNFKNAKIVFIPNVACYYSTYYAGYMATWNECAALNFVDITYTVAKGFLFYTSVYKDDDLLHCNSYGNSQLASVALHPHTKISTIINLYAWSNMYIYADDENVYIKGNRPQSYLIMDLSDRTNTLLANWLSMSTPYFIGLCSGTNTPAYVTYDKDNKQLKLSSPDTTNAIYINTFRPKIAPNYFN